LGNVVASGGPAFISLKLGGAMGETIGRVLMVLGMVHVFATFLVVAIYLRTGSLATKEPTETHKTTETLPREGLPER